MNGYTWEYISTHQKETKRLLGISFQQLEQLIELAKVLQKEQQTVDEIKNPRLVAKGGGRSCLLSVEEQIILTLMYLRHNLTFQILGIMFKISESTAHNLFNYWQKILKEGLPASLLEQVKKSDEDLDSLLEELTEYELVVDSAEQVIERPLDYQEQKKNYSGKKKNHTFKNQLIILPEGTDIVDAVVGKPGPVSDIKLCRERLSQFNQEQRLIGDKAYVGEAQIKTPMKKPKNAELNLEQKEDNKELSKRRIYVEHIIRTIKIFRCAQERFRLNKKRYAAVMLTILGLVRLRIKSLILEIIKTDDSGELFTIIKHHSLGKILDL
jgi:hypothetical protein